MQKDLEQSMIDSLSTLIATKRKQANLTEEELAASANISAHRIRALEEGKEWFGLDVLSKLASAFDTSVFELIAEAQEIDRN